KKQDVFCNMLWSLVNNVQIVLSSVMIIVGNHLLPTVLLAQMESSQSHVSWRRSERNAPLRLLHHTNARDVEISFLKCKEFSMSKAYRLNARSGPPPRTMGIFEMDEAPSSAPHCNIFIDLGSDVEIAYGPWADAQRLILMEFFHPIDYRIAEITKLPKRGERQILKQVNLVITAKENAHIDLWFMRDDDLNVVLMTAKRRTSVEISLPLTTSQSGSNVSLRCVFEGFICSTSLTLRKLFESDVINADITAQFPRVYNGIQNWTISLRFWRTSAWFIWDQTTFFMASVC
uniref:Bridge-like lipid transfer protein family member 1 N-terminal domain-containing protein n=1 Tax=Parascaris univalens TaxID=6257 RepID=A0A915A523_PARUN